MTPSGALCHGSLGGSGRRGASGGVTGRSNSTGLPPHALHGTVLDALGPPDENTLMRARCGLALGRRGQADFCIDRLVWRLEVRSYGRLPSRGLHPGFRVAADGSLLPSTSSRLDGCVMRPASR